MRLFRLLPLFTICLDAAALSTLDWVTGFLPRDGGGGYWALSSAGIVTFDGQGMHFHRQGRTVDIQVPGGELHWAAEGDKGATVNMIGRESQTLRSSARLRASSVIEGIDWVVSFREGNLKSEFQLQPGIRAEAVSYCFSGAKPMLDEKGTGLRVVAAEDWEWKEQALAVWQVTKAGEKWPVNAHFVVKDACVGFEVGDTDPDLPLVLDPEIVFSTFVGGGLVDTITALTHDAQGNTYAGGYSESRDLPQLLGLSTTVPRPINGFVAKINPAGQLVYLTIVGGTGDDRVAGLAVDGGGYLYVAGTTNSADFPRVAAAYNGPRGGRDAFLARLTPGGDQMVFSTYLGGTNDEEATGVALSPDGSVVMCGETASYDFPVAGGRYLNNGGGKDGFVTRFNSSGVLLSSTYLGGGGEDRVNAVTVAPDGTVHVTGLTTSSNFPVLLASQGVRSGGMDAFYTRMNGGLNTLEISTYLGGSDGSFSAPESGNGIAIDSGMRIWIGGITPSTNFPGVALGYQKVYGGGKTDGFVSVLSYGGAVQWSSYLGGMFGDEVKGVAAKDSAVAVAGWTYSRDFPVANAQQPASAGDYEGFYALYSGGTVTPYTQSFLGGSGSDGANAVSIGYTMEIAGTTGSANFSVKAALQSDNPDDGSGFVTRVGMAPEFPIASPSTGVGGQQTFSFTVTDVIDGESITYLLVVINGTLNVQNGCYIHYNRDSNLLHLWRDEDANWLPLIPGGQGTVENSQCLLVGSASNILKRGRELTVRASIRFKPGFSGEKQIYLKGQNVSGAILDWTKVGNWGVTAYNGPYAMNVSPYEGSGSQQNFVVSVSDDDGAADLEYVLMIINDTLRTQNGCYLHYHRSSNSVYLWRESDSAWLPMRLSTGTIAESDYCVLFGVNSNLIADGKTLSITFSLRFKAALNGRRNIYLKSQDKAGSVSDWSPAGSWDVTDYTGPILQSVSPTEGISSYQNFVATITDPDGATDVDYALIIINNNLSITGGCYIHYHRSTNILYLWRENDSVWLEVRPGSSDTAENPKCVLSGPGSGITKHGNELSLTLSLYFKPEFAGFKEIYMKSQDADGAIYDWNLEGHWTVTAPVGPYPAGVVPSSGNGDAEAFSLVIHSPGGADSITYALMIINSALIMEGGCYVHFNRDANAIYLWREADSAWLALPVGSAASVENANCILNGHGSTIMRSGSTLKVTFALQFKPTFTGLKTIYVKSQDAAGLIVDWTPIGSWLLTELSL